MSRVAPLVGVMASPNNSNPQQPGAVRSPFVGDHGEPSRIPEHRAVDIPGATTREYASLPDSRFGESHGLPFSPDSAFHIGSLPIGYGTSPGHGHGHMMRSRRRLGRQVRIRPLRFCSFDRYMFLASQATCSLSSRNTNICSRH